MVRIGLASLLLLAWQGERVERLIRQLEADDIEVRSLAEQRLLEQGRAALPALRSALGDSTDARGMHLRGIIERIAPEEAARAHDSAERRRQFDMRHPAEGVRGDWRWRPQGHVLVNTTWQPAAGVQLRIDSLAAKDDKGQTVETDRCARCVQRLAVVRTIRTFSLRVKGVCRWFSEYPVRFENPKTGDGCRIGSFRIEVQWPKIVITSDEDIDDVAMRATCLKFSFKLRSAVRCPTVVVSGG